MTQRIKDQQPHPFMRLLEANGWKDVRDSTQVQGHNYVSAESDIPGSDMLLVIGLRWKAGDVLHGHVTLAGEASSRRYRLPAELPADLTPEWAWLYWSEQDRLHPEMAD